MNGLLAEKYHNTFGRPAWKPEVMVRIGILQKMYDLSDEAVIDEIAVNRAFEYFCHLSPLDDLPHPSTLCKFRKMRLDENIMDDIMTEIVRQMIEKGIIKKEAGIVIDSTHIHANTIKKVPERLMEHMAKNIFREKAEKDGLTGEEAEAFVKEKAKGLPQWEEYEDHTEAKKDMKEALEFSYNKDSDTWTCINGNESGTGRKKKKRITIRSSTCSNGNAVAIAPTERNA